MIDKIICLVGESGSGKTTIAELLEKEGFNYIQSYTTRKPRYPNEKGHIFIDNIEDSSDFDMWDSVYYPKKNVIAYTYFDGHHYWATKEQYKNKGTSIYVIDPDGVNLLKEKVKDAKLITIYLKADTEVRIHRMLQRQDRFLVQTQYYNVYKKILERVFNDVDKFNIINCNYVVNANKDKYKVLSDIKSILDNTICE